VTNRHTPGIQANMHHSNKHVPLVINSISAKKTGIQKRMLAREQAAPLCCNELLRSNNKINISQIGNQMYNFFPTKDIQGQ